MLFVLSGGDTVDGYANCRKVESVRLVLGSFGSFDPPAPGVSLPGFILSLERSRCLISVVFYVMFYVGVQDMVKLRAPDRFRL